MPLLRNIAGLGNTDPIPGKIYYSKVVNENNQPIKAGWLFLDAEGNPISQDFFTDNNGYFHFTVPETNWQKIFLYFYSTEQYNDVVKSFSELVNEDAVILTFKSKGKLPTGLLLAGGAMAVIALSERKTIGNTNYFKGENKGRNIAIAAGGAIAIIYLLSYKPNQQQKEYLKQAKNMLAYLAAEKGIVPSLTDTQFASLAVQIRKAVAKCGTEEDVIFHAFNSLNNEADIYKLIIECNIMSYDGCFEGSLPRWRVHYTLTEALYSDLNIDDIDYINSILSNKGIKFQF